MQSQKDIELFVKERMTELAKTGQRTRNSLPINKFETGTKVLGLEKNELGKFAYNRKGIIVFITMNENIGNVLYNGAQDLSCAMPWNYDVLWEDGELEKYILEFHLKASPTETI